MILYHFATSPYARRVRLALSHKGLSAELRDARARPEHMEEVRRLNPTHTVPVLVDGGLTIVDSAAICQYIDRKIASPPLWPEGLAGAEVFEITALADNAISRLSDLGMRYYALHDHPGFGAVRELAVGRAQRALDALAGRVSARPPGAPLCGDRWGMADIVVFTAVAWFEGLPARAPTFPPARQVVSLGWSLPAALSAWADRHRGREDVVALDAV